LAIDIEPGLLDAYQEEDLFPEAHTKFSSEGFWLSDITVKGPVRINQRSLTKLKEINPEYSLMYIGRNLKKCPGWVEARYLRTISHLESINSPARNYVLLWVFSMLDQQYGYCLDIASAYKDKFGDDHTFNVLWNTAFDHLPIPEPKIVKQESFFKKVKSKIARRIKG